MTVCQIKLRGCDEVTEFVMDLDDTEAEVVSRVAAQSRENSPYDCYPVMTIERQQ